MSTCVVIRDVEREEDLDVVGDIERSRGQPTTLVHVMPVEVEHASAALLCWHQLYGWSVARELARHARDHGARYVADQLTEITDRARVADARARKRSRGVT